MSDIILLQITMTKEWLLLLLLQLFISYQNVDSQPTTGCYRPQSSETRCNAAFGRMLNNQEQIFKLLYSQQQQLETIKDCHGKFPAKSNVGNDPKNVGI